MNQTEFLRLLPDLQTIAELFPGCRMQCGQEAQLYRSMQLYTPGQTLQPERLYLIRGGDGFPVDTHAWISCDELTGRADHICCPGYSREEILNGVLMLYAGMQEQEHTLDDLLYRGSGLDALCELGSQLLGNPVYIHDDWFIMIAKSSRMDEIITPEYIMSSEKGFLPRAIIDDFRDDTDYLETYAFHSAQMWSNGGNPCLYVNLWDGSVYRGRLLVVESDCPIRHRDYRLAEVLAQAALLLIRNKRLGEHHTRSMDDIMQDLLQGVQPDAAEQNMLLSMLKWSKQDQLLCVRLQSQQSATATLVEHALHSELFRSFADSYIMIAGSQQCLILNLSRNPGLRRDARHILAPICRDYCLYAGISSPVGGIRDLRLAAIQADAALSHAFRVRNEQWIVSFPECALEYLIDHMDSQLQPWNLISPELLYLMDYDRENGTTYFETLQAYLLHERDIPRTSEALIIHRTTLLYRLKKIQSLTPLNLDNPHQRLYLLLSLHLLKQEERQE